MHASTAATAPYFFLSYAHKSHGESRDGGEVDYWVGEFFRDLCRSVERQANLPKGASSGFMDGERRSENEWPIGVLLALASCRVFVPLYSSQYFADEYCGKEWNYFTHRTRDLSAQDAPIVPGIWDPVEPGKLPQAARAPLSGYRGGDACEARGLYEIMKLSRYRNEYAQAVDDLAGRIVTEAARHPLRQGSTVDPDGLEGAFDHDRTRHGTARGRQLRITVVAPRQDELPTERMNSYC